MTHRAALRVVLALRADDFDDLFLKQLGEHTEPDADAQGEQPFLRRADQLAERLLSSTTYGLPDRGPSMCRGRWAQQQLGLD